MDLKEIFNIIKEKKWLVFWMSILGAVIIFDLLILLPPKYQSNSKILVVQKQVEGQDIYSVSKSAQYLTRMLKEAIYSDSFFEKTIKDSSLVDDFFSENKKERRKNWQKSVSINIVRDLGAMEIDVERKTREEAQIINEAIVKTLKENHQIYHGGSQIRLEVLDYPFADKDPESFHLWLGVIFGALAGFAFGANWAVKKSK